MNLREERRRRGKGLRAMAEEVGVTRRVLAAAENGATPRAENQLLIAEFFGFDLLEQWPDPEPAEAAA